MYYDIKYQKGLQSYYERQNQLSEYSDDSYSKFLKLYTELPGLAPFMKKSLVNILGLDRDSSITPKLLNTLATHIYMDTRVLAAMLNHLANASWYTSVIRDATRDFLVSVIANLNDNQRKVAGDYVNVPFVPYLESTNATGYSTPKFSTVKLDVKKYCSYSVSLSSADGEVRQGNVQGLQDGTGITIISDYSMTGQQVVFSVNPTKNADTMVLEFNDDIEHFVQVKDHKAKIVGGAIVKEQFNEPFNITISTFDYKRMGTKQHVTSIKKLTMCNANVESSTLSIRSNIDTKPLELDVEKKGIYAGYGSVLVDVVQDETRRLGSITKGGVHTSPFVLSKKTKAIYIPKKMDFVTVRDLNDPVDYSKIVVYGKYDEAKGYQTGYKTYDDKKYSFAYLESMPDCESVYDLFGKEIDEIDKPNVYLVEWGDSKPDVDCYSHIADPSWIKDDRVNIPSEVEKTLEFSEHETTSFTPADSYSMSIQKPVLFNKYTTASWEDTDKGVSFSLDIDVEQGYVTMRDFAVVVVVEKENDFDVVMPYNTSLTEPIEEDPNELVKPIVNVNYSGDFSGATLTAYVYNITGFNSKTINNDGLRFSINTDNYISGLLVVPILETQREFTTSIDGEEFDMLFDTPRVGTHTVTVSSTEEFTCDGLVVIPILPTTLTSTNIKYEPGYVIEGVYDTDKLMGSLFEFVQDGSVVESVTDGEFKIDILGTATANCRLLFERGNDDEALMVYATGGMSVRELQLTLNGNDTGFQPVVTVPKLKYTLRW